MYVAGWKWLLLQLYYTILVTWLENFLCSCYFIRIYFTYVIIIIIIIIIMNQKTHNKKNHWMISMMMMNHLCGSFFFICYFVDFFLLLEVCGRFFSYIYRICDIIFAYYVYQLILFLVTVLGYYFFEENLHLHSQQKKTKPQKICHIKTKYIDHYHHCRWIWSKNVIIIIIDFMFERKMVKIITLFSRWWFFLFIIWFESKKLNLNFQQKKNRNSIWHTWLLT